ncbi:MAG: hypothetical protein COU90_00400 [Candidatus Ryanbacteria bacterium CG10_big_fil_rev_8_21_14_0_10_43_42]|uniref:Uncharacterized protein n=1 Tax=Candidatus Ryanbacteria bacterium CG10_big_fil_rev_8_21_14_0_10_43_42 TaxID=1974864 RepID=A0A2M8KXV2_9BACT|nr:MAG: hypothetical protein COU90_00400 [Candidatus Ryanbacteria bacterium CG10_big_fil_rev_8_21_14_0_10_43_42]
MYSILTSNVDWIVLLLLGGFLLSLLRQSSEEGKLILLAISISFISFGLFRKFFPERRLLWLSDDKINIYIRIAVWFTVLLSAYIVHLSLVCC